MFCTSFAGFSPGVGFSTISKESPWGWSGLKLTNTLGSEHQILTYPEWWLLWGLRVQRWRPREFLMADDPIGTAILWGHTFVGHGSNSDLKPLFFF